MSARAKLVIGALLGLVIASGCRAPVETEGLESAAEHEYAGDLVSDDRLAALAKQAGLPCSAVTLATAVALGESEGYAAATHYNGDGSVDRGLWQINSTAWPQYGSDCVFDPECNARAMAAISGNGSSFLPWVAYTNGRYQQFYARAQAAYAHLAACGGTGGGGGGVTKSPGPPGPCGLGDGDYCGGNGGGSDLGTLYRCNGNQLSVAKKCALGCAWMPNGENDRCRTSATCPQGAGLYCGGNGVDGDPGVLFQCGGGRISPVQRCAKGCRAMAASVNDECAK